MPAPSEEASDGKPKSIVHRFPLKGTGFPAHPADIHGALANWADVYGVMIGPRKQPFALHRHVVEKIPLLRDRLLISTDSLESRTGSMALDEVDTMSFAVAIDFAYTGHFDEERIKLHYAKPDEDEDEDEGEDVASTPDPISNPSFIPNTSAEADAEAEFLLLLDPALRSTKSESEDPVQLFTTSSPSPHPAELEPEAEPEDSDEDAILPTYDNLLVSLFDLAQALQYEALANAVIDAYARVLAEDPPSAWALGYLQRKGLEISKMMDMMLRAVAWCIRAEGYEAWSDADFMVGWITVNVRNGGLVMAAMAGWRDECNPFEDGLDTCEWHTHVVTEKCRRRKRVNGGEGGGGNERSGKSKKQKKP